MCVRGVFGTLVRFTIWRFSWFGIFREWFDLESGTSAVVDLTNVSEWIAEIGCHVVGTHFPAVCDGRSVIQIHGTNRRPTDRQRVQQPQIEESNHPRSRTFRPECVCQFAKQAAVYRAFYLPSDRICDQATHLHNARPSPKHISIYDNYDDISNFIWKPMQFWLLPADWSSASRKTPEFPASFGKLS